MSSRIECFWMEPVELLTPRYHGHLIDGWLEEC